MKRAFAILGILLIPGSLFAVTIIKQPPGPNSVTPETISQAEGDFTFPGLKVSTGPTSSALYVSTQTGGMVGIGMDNPTEALDVEGNVKASGIFYGDGSGLTNLSGLAPGSTDYIQNGHDLQADSKMHITSGTITNFTSETLFIRTPGGGAVLTSPGGICYKIKVKDNGVLQSEGITCP